MRADYTAMRGVVTTDGQVVMWPMLLADHNQVLAQLPHLSDYRCRWRQWYPREEPDFDAPPPGVSADRADLDRIRVRESLHECGALPRRSHG